MGESGLPPGRTGIETLVNDLQRQLLKCQDYPPAGLGLRRTLGRSLIHESLVRTTPRPDWD